MDESILISIKKVLGIPAEYTHFDLDIIMHINTAFSTLQQLGVGMDEGFMIQDETTTWLEFIPEDPRFNFVKTYIFQKVRLMFDPPASSAHIDALKESIRELECRLTYLVDEWNKQMEVLENGN